jgi:hypothetical protein
MSVVGTNGRFTPLQAGQFSNAGPLGGAAGMPNQVSPPGLFPGDALPEGTSCFCIFLVQQPFFLYLLMESWTGSD